MENSLGIYVHVPFCKSKCPYCSFYSVKDCDRLQQLYTESLASEIVKWGKRLPKIKTVDTVYFGGGTPSVLELPNILRILSLIKENFTLKDPEITLEVNPADYSYLDFEKLAEGGVNRVSVGAQSLNGEGLKILGRRHSAKDTEETCKQVKNAGIKNISLDLIVGYPGQTKKDIKKFIDFCAENQIPHISAYLLKVEEGTPYGKSKLRFASDELCSDFYMYISSTMKKLGYNHYEISNFSLPGKESRHNLKYWNLNDYLGLGPSAHSLLGRERFYYEGDLGKFISSAAPCSEGKGGSPEEYVMLRLRLASGISKGDYEKRFGVSMPQDYFRKAERFEKLGLVEIHEGRINLTPKGFLLSNKIIGDLIF